MPNPDTENIDCKAVRKRLGLTAIEFAKLLGVRVETISRWEHGHHRPTGLYAIRLAEIAQQAGPN
jgi:DNA-binding transcriptional regulator YiaG